MPPLSWLNGDLRLHVKFNFWTRKEDQINLTHLGLCGESTSVKLGLTSLWTALLKTFMLRDVAAIAEGVMLCCVAAKLLASTVVASTRSCAHMTGCCLTCELPAVCWGRKRGGSGLLGMVVSRFGVTGALPSNVVLSLSLWHQQSVEAVSSHWDQGQRRSPWEMTPLAGHLRIRGCCRLPDVNRDPRKLRAAR